jgi:drug/metabolite transporter (DMT)-like permease
MTAYWQAAALGGLVTVGGSGLAYASALTGPPSAETALGFLAAGLLLLVGYAAGRRHTLLAAGWAAPVVAGVLVLVTPDVATLREFARILALLGAGTAAAWVAVDRGLAATKRVDDRVW